jgi:hypothetical protein
MQDPMIHGGGKPRRTAGRLRLVTAAGNWLNYPE